MSGGIAAIAVLAAVIFRLVDQDQAVRVSCREVRPEIRDSRSAPQAESAAAPVRSDIAALPGSGSGSSPSRFPTVAYLLRAYESPETGEPENCRFQWLSADDCEKYLLYCLPKRRRLTPVPPVHFTCSVMAAASGKQPNHCTRSVSRIRGRSGNSRAAPVMFSGSHALSIG